MRKGRKESDLMTLDRKQTDKQTGEARRADPADVATIDDILQALYEVISFPPGGRPDWARARTLFAPGARLIPPGAQGEALRVMSIDEFIEFGNSLFEENESLSQGFYENDVFRRVERFGSIAHVLSTYESRHAADDAEPFERGVNSIQLYNDGARWWTVTIFWETERADNPIPAEYLSSK
jgi:hypothetical protein